jgi:TPR repeat protein
VITAVLVKDQGGPSGQLATTEVPPSISARLQGKSGPDVAVRTPPMTQMSPEFVRIKPSDEEIAALVAAGRQLIVAGDIPNARLVLQQAADAGSAPAALALGGTYDPTLPQAQPAGPVPNPLSDVAMARAWYEKARDLGSTEARVRLDRLTNHSSGGR